MLGSPFIGLGSYRPTRRRASVIGPELVAYTASFGFVPHKDQLHGPQEGAAWCSKEAHAEVRMTAVPGSQGEDWHQDGDTTPGANMRCLMVLWAASDPTQFRWRGDSRIYQPEPYEVVVVNNLHAEHRRPPGLSGRRWSFRQRVRWVC